MPREPVTPGPRDFQSPPPTAGGVMRQQLDLGRRLFRGLVVDYHSYLNVYSITRHQGATIQGTTAGMPVADHFGVRSGVTLSPGTEVLCLLSDTSDFCFILAAIPTQQTWPGLLISDWIFPHSGVTILEDAVHGGVLDATGTVRNHNVGRPYDALAGDYTLLNTLGVGLHVGLIDAFLRAGDDTGVWAYKHNGLLRLAGRRLQLWTPGVELESADDEGELVEVEERCIYPWESLGLRRPGAALRQSDPSRTYDPDIGADPHWVEGSHSAKYEPRFADQRMAARAVSLRGYVGDLSRELVVVQDPAQDVDRLGSATPAIGLSEVYRGSDGAVDIRSRRCIRIEKSSFIAVPRRVKPVEDPTGDTAEHAEYKSSGHFGDGEDHDRTEPPVPDRRLAVTGLPDHLAWERSKLGMLGVKGRRDFKVAREADTHGHSGVSVDDGVHVSGAKFRAPQPSFLELELDHREGNQRRYYKSRAGIYITDDGKVVIEDAWGSQIVMSDGNITLTCAGDAVTATGRSIIGMAPNDVCLRAGHAVDVSAGTGDMRLKAERNLHVLGGNSGSGGVLVESRSVGYTQDFSSKIGDDVVSSGVVIKASEGPVAVYGQTVYMRSTDSGNVVLDADDGRGSVQTYGRDTLTIVRQSQTTLFGIAPSSSAPPTAAEVHTGNAVSFGQAGTVGFIGNLLVGGRVTVNSDVTARGVASRSGGELSQWAPGTANAIANGLGQFRDTNTSAQGRSAETRSTSMPYAEQGYGLETVISSIGFSFRTDEQYGVDFEGGDGEPALFLPEARWQQGLRRAGVTETWTEPGVTAPGTSVVTMPFPGAGNWTENPVFASLELSHWSPEDGDQYDLSAYDPAVEPTVSRVTPESGYVIKHAAT